MDTATAAVSLLGYTFSSCCCAAPCSPPCRLATPLCPGAASSSGSFGDTHIGDWYADTQAMLQYFSHRQPTGKKVVVGAAKGPGGQGAGAHQLMPHSFMGTPCLQSEGKTDRLSAGTQCL